MPAFRLVGKVPWFVLATCLANWLFCGELNAVSPIAHPAASQVPGLLVVALGRGHYNRLRLAATVEGTKGLLILDTGASATLLSEGKFRSLLPGPDRKLPAGVPATVSVNGVRWPVTLARDFYVGGTNLGSSAVVLSAQRYLYDQAFAGNQQYDGLLGENFLRRYRAVVDCGRLALYLNTNPNRPLNLGPALVQAGWTRVPMSNLHNDFVVPCEINNRHFRMVVDTGEPFVSMDRGMLAGAQVATRDIPVRTGIIGTRGEDAGFVRLPACKVGSYTVNNLQVVADAGNSRYFQDEGNDQANGKILGLLGGSFLASNNAIIDVGGSALYLKPNGKKADGN